MRGGAGRGDRSWKGEEKARRYKGGGGGRHCDESQPASKSFQFFSKV